MHELAVMSSILKTVLDTAAKNQVSRIVAINLRVGQMTHLLDEWMQKYFDHLSMGTPAEGALLKIERSALVFTCQNCATNMTVEKKEWDLLECPQCGSANLVMTAGREFYIKDIEVI